MPLTVASRSSNAEIRNSALSNGRSNNVKSWVFSFCNEVSLVKISRKRFLKPVLLTGNQKLYKVFMLSVLYIVLGALNCLPGTYAVECYLVSLTLAPDKSYLSSHQMNSQDWDIL